MSRNRELCEFFHKLWCKTGNRYAYRRYQVFFQRYQKRMFSE